MTDLQSTLVCTCTSGCNTTKCSCGYYSLVCFLSCSDCKEVCANIASFPDEIDSKSYYENQ